MVLPPTQQFLLSGAMELICFAAFVVLRIRWQHGPQWSAKGYYSLVFQSNGWWLVEIPYWFKITFLPRNLGISSSSTQD